MRNVITLYRVDIRDEGGREYYTKVEADSIPEAREVARRNSLLMGDKITKVDGPFFVTGRARFEHGWVDNT